MAVNSDRFSRRNGEMDALLYLCERSGVRLIMGGQEVDPAQSPMGKAMAQIGGVLAELESGIKSVRVKAAKEEGARRGTYTGGPRPFGFEKDGVTIREDEAKLVRELYERIIGGEGFPAIARDWQARGVRNGNGNPYRPADLRQTVGRARYAGLRVHRGEVVGKAEWEGIVTPEEWQRAQAAIKARGGQQPRTGKERRSALLSGLLRCDGCGRRMRIHAYRDGRRPPRYICTEFDCHTSSIYAETVEEEVEARVLARLTDPKSLKRIEKAASKIPDYEKLMSQVAILEEDLEALARDFGDGLISRTEWMSARGGIEDRLRIARKKLTEAELHSGVLIDASGAVKSWNALGMEQKRTLIGTLVDSVTISRGIRGKFDPKRVRVTWRV